MNTSFLKDGAMLFVLMLLLNLSFAQAPEKFQYQAVARDGQGAVLANQNVSLRISILEASPSGNVVFQEEHSIATNQFGLLSIEIGGGSILLGSLGSISWEANSHFVQVEMDETGGSNYGLMGSSQLLSVPYAMHASTVENESQDLQLSGTDLSISGGGTVDLSVIQDGINDADSDPSNEIQTLNVSGNDLSISGGNTITLPQTADNWGADVVNSDGTLIGDGTVGNPLGVNGDLTDDQNLSLSGTNLTIDNGNSVDLSSIDTDTQLSEAQVDTYVANNGYLTSPNDADADPNNEIQTLSLSGNDLTISGGNVVTLPTGADNWGTDVVNSDPSLSGDGTIGNPLSVNGDLTDDQGLSLTGTMLNIDNGTGVDLSVIQDGVTDPDADPSNEIQTLSISGNDLTISGGNTVTLPSGGGGSSHWSKTGNKVYVMGDTVGIGISTPSYPLEIRTGTVVGQEKGFIHSNGATLLGSEIDNFSNGGLFGTFSNHDFFLASNGIPRAYFRTNGNIGLETDTLIADGSGDFYFKQKSTLLSWGNSMNFIAQNTSDPVGIGGDITMRTGASSNVNGTYELRNGNNLSLLAREGSVRIGADNSFGYKPTQIALGIYEVEEKLTVVTGTSEYGLLHTNGSIKLGTYVGGAQSDAYFGTKSNHDLHFFTNDGSPILTVSKDDKVGIGKAVPTKELDVIGDAHIEGNLTWKAHEGIVSVGPHDFIDGGKYTPSGSAEVVAQLTIFRDSYRINWQDGFGTGYVVEIRAPLNLPQGATITEVWGDAISDGPSGAGYTTTFILRRVPLDGTPAQNLATGNINFNTMSTSESVTVTSISNPVVDNNNYYYEIFTTVPDYATYKRSFSAARVKYTTTTPH